MIKALKFLNILLMLLIFPVSSLIVRNYLIYKYNPQEKEVIKSSVAVYKPVQNDIQRYAPIIENAVFPTSHSRLTPIDLNKDISGEAVDNGKDVNLPISDNLYLRGTIIGQKNYAIFETKGDRKEGIFKVGESVFETGVLRNVVKDKALLLRGSKELSFDIDTENIHIFPSPNKQPPQKYADLSPLSKKVGEKEWVIDQRAIFKALEDMSQVLTDARLTPNVAEGKVEGFRITEIKHRGIFDAIGLKNGDVLIKVNNYDIDTPEKAIQVISGIKGETRVNLDLMRDGQRVSFNYQIR
ncbi:MAG: PDZ domain-containing protein [Nitrospinae bacterium]|nr:PDZ domain-containing protein [Nitrospinota bacterium]